MRNRIDLSTPRLTLAGADDALLRAELDGHAALAAAIGATVPAD